MSKKAKNSSSTRNASGKRQEGLSRRNVLVMVSLFGALTLTSMLLLALAPAPLDPGAARSLFVTESRDAFQQIFETRAPFQSSQWQYIYIHHSRSRRGDAATLGQDGRGMGDHFLIGNGDGCADGEIQVGQRWNQQQPAQPAGAKVAGNCISICLVGDFDRNSPTDSQMASLGQLVQAIQSQCRIPAERVLTYSTPASPMGIGRRFPSSDFSRQLRP